jgi:hypothetical protein
MRTGIATGAGAAVCATPGAGVVTDTGATAGVTADGAVSQQLVELADLQPVNKKRDSAATKKPTGQRAKHFVFFIIVFGLCDLRFGFQQKCGDVLRSGKRKAGNYLRCL